MATADPDTSNRDDTSENSPGKEGDEKSEEASDRDFEVSRTQGHNIDLSGIRVYTNFFFLSMWVEGNHSKQQCQKLPSARFL